MSEPAPKIITTQLPTYLQALLQEGPTVRLAFLEKKEVKVVQQPVLSNTVEVSTEVSELDLTGNPLQTDLGSDDTLLISDVPQERPPSWTAEEAQQGPFRLDEARVFANKELKFNRSVFCLCDGSDNNHSVGLGADVSSQKISRTLVYILPCCDETEVLNWPHMEREHISKSVRRNATIKTSNKKMFSLFGHNLKNCSSLAHCTEHNGCIWLEIPHDNSNATMNLQVIVGHNSSQVLPFWEELSSVQRFIKQLENSKLLTESTVIASENPVLSDDLTDLISDVMNNATGAKRKVNEVLDLKNLRPCNVLDNFWNILKHCNTLCDLRNGFNVFFEELYERQSPVHLSKEDNSTVADIVNGILDGKIAVPTLGFSQCLELLVDLGLEKLKNDYVAILRGLYGNVTDVVSKKWNELRADTSFKSSTLRQTRISINPKAAIIDLKSTKVKFAYLNCLHKAIEFMFLYKDNIKFYEESFDSFCGSLCDKVITKFKNCDVNQPRLGQFSWCISSSHANKYVQDVSLLASTTKLVSKVNTSRVTTVFHFSQHPIFPPIVFDNYDVSAATQDSKSHLYYVTKLVNYVQSC